jgi:hypothetical protein
VLAAWAKENHLTGIYPRTPVSKLPKTIRDRLRERKLLPLINRFPATSGRTVSPPRLMP